MSPQNSIATPKAARLTDLVECLHLLKSRPLKLIAEAARAGWAESEWSEALWTFSRNGEAVTDKKILALPEDSFQVSVANEHSRQDFHLHRSVTEIYMSQFPIELVYQTETSEESLCIPSGVVIVPPGCAHQVKLHGLAFVCQVAGRDRQVHNDKTVLSRAAEI